MRDFLEDLGKRIGETAETMTNMAGEAIEIQRLKSQIRTLASGGERACSLRCDQRQRRDNGRI